MQNDTRAVTQLLVILLMYKMMYMATLEVSANIVYVQGNKMGDSLKL